MKYLSVYLFAYIILLPYTRLFAQYQFAQPTIRHQTKGSLNAYVLQTPREKIEKQITLYPAPKPRKDGKGLSPYFGEGGLPESIALITFAGNNAVDIQTYNSYHFRLTQDTIGQEFNINRGEMVDIIKDGHVTYMQTHSQINGLTDDGAHLLTTALFNEGYPTAKFCLAQEGITLQTIHEAAQGAGQWEAYMQYEFDYSFLLKAAVLAINPFMAGNIKGKVSTAAAGFRSLWVPTSVSDDVGNETLGQLAEKLGVDAVAVYYVDFRYEKKRMVLDKVRMAIFGPNPVPKDPNKKYPGKSYFDYMMYVGAELQFKNPTILVTGLSEKGHEAEYLEGFSYIMEILNTAAMNKLKELARPN